MGQGPSVIQAKAPSALGPWALCLASQGPMGSGVRSHGPRGQGPGLMDSWPSQNGVSPNGSTPNGPWAQTSHGPNGPAPKWARAWVHTSHRSKRAQGQIGPGQTNPGRHVHGPRHAGDGCKEFLLKIYVCCVLIMGLRSWGRDLSIHGGEIPI